MIALLILAIALLALAGLMVTTTRNSSFGGHMTEASTFAQDKLEQLRVSPWAGVATGNDTTLGSTGIAYTRNWTVTPNANGNQRWVSITLTWTDPTTELKSLDETSLGGRTVEWRKSMKIRLILNKNGVTLIELLVVLAITAITMAGIYRVFVSQTKTYAVQDQVMEVQQSVRGAMEILLRDLRMTGFDDDNVNSDVTIANPVATPVQTSDITINYEYYDRNLVGTEAQRYQSQMVRYWRDGGTSRLMRQLTVDAVGRPAEIILENVDALTFTYGVDQNQDGIMDDQNGNGQIDNNDWLSAAGVVALGNPRVVAINISLTGRSDQTNTDVSKVISPRTLVSAVTLRNLSLR